MGRFKFKSALVGVASVLAASTALFADATVDGKFDNNANDFEHYWYYYDDNSGCGSDDRPAVKKAGKDAGTPSVISVVSPGDTVNLNGDKMKKYTFTTGTETATNNKYATLPFTLGSTWTTSYGKGRPFVGIGTQLAADGKSTDITGVTAVKFKIRSHTGAISVIDFKIQLKAIDDASQVATPPAGAFAYHENRNVPVTTSWAEQTVLVSSLEQPTWLKAPNPLKIAFDPKTVTKLAWEVKEEDNVGATTDTIDIDDITLIGDYTFTPPALWTKKEADLTVPASGKFADFEGTQANVSPLGTYWYAYNDVEIGGTSVVNSGADKQDNGRLLITFSEKTGSDGNGQGALLDYTLGKTVKQGENDVQGFVGIGCNLYDSLNSIYWNATAAGANSIYFQYTTTGDLDKATIEISDMNDVADASHPTRKDSRGSGIVYYRDLPKTAEGTWVAVKIPLDSLVWHEDWSGSHKIAFDATKLAKVQWKVQGGEALGGKIAIDNVYFPGASQIALPVKHLNNKSIKSADFAASYLNGNINVNWNMNLAKGKVSVINTLGATVSSSSIAKANNANISAMRLPAGMYFVKLNAVNANGQSVTKQSAISIVK